MSCNSCMYVLFMCGSMCLSVCEGLHIQLWKPEAQVRGFPPQTLISITELTVTRGSRCVLNKQ